MEHKNFMLWRTFWGSKKFACTSLPHKFPLSNVHVWETIDNDTQFNIVWVGISRNSGITTQNRWIYPKSTFFNFLTVFWVGKHQKPPNPFDDIKYPPPISNIGGHPQHIPTHLAPIVGYHLGTHPNFIHKKHTQNSMLKGYPSFFPDTHGDMNQDGEEFHTPTIQYIFLPFTDYHSTSMG